MADDQDRPAVVPAPRAGLAGVPRRRLPAESDQADAAPVDAPGHHVGR